MIAAKILIAQSQINPYFPTSLGQNWFDISDELRWLDIRLIEKLVNNICYLLCRVVALLIPWAPTQYKDV